MCVDGVPFRERGRPCYYIFSAFKYDEQNRRWHPCVRLDSSKVPSSTINDLSPCLPRRWSRRWCSWHDGTDTRPAVLRKPLLRHPRAGTNTWLRIRLSTGAIGGISALAARGGRTCAHQTIRSTATSFFHVNPVCKHGLVIKFSEYTTIRTRPVKHCANGDSDGSWFIDTYTWICSDWK